MSALDIEYARRGLVRPGRVTRQLHVTPDVPSKILTVVDIPWKGAVHHGFRAEDVVAAHDKMWPRCPWAAKGLCEIEQGRRE